MNKTALYGTDIWAWMHDIVDREGITELPDEQLMPRVNGDVEFCPASQATKDLLCVVIAIGHAMRRAYAEAVENGSETAEQDFKYHERWFTMPMLQSIKLLIPAQLMLDLNQAGIDRTGFFAITVAEGGVIVGYKDRATVLEAGRKAAGRKTLLM